MKMMRSFFISKIMLLSIAVFLCVGFAVSLAVKSQASYNVAKAKKVVVIDAGHGGIDPGVIGLNSGLKESDLNLIVANMLKQCFENAGVTVIMTRTTQSGLYDDTIDETDRKAVDMKNRGEIIKNSKADIAISIHMNKISDKRCHGAQVFYQEGSSPILAKYIQDSINVNMGSGNTRLEHTGDYFVLKAGEMPSVIVECGFLSNASDEKNLIDPTYQSQITWAIFNGVMQYWEENQ